MTRPAMHTLLNQAQTFLAVVDFGSYTKAADFLGISKAMASLHVKALEEALAVTLLVRSTRALADRGGQGVPRRIQDVVRDMEGAFENIMHQGRRISGKLRISTTSEYGERFVLPLIPDFVAQHPGISVCYDVNASLSDLLAEKLDLVVRLGNWRTPASGAASWRSTTSCWWRPRPSCASIPSGGRRIWPPRPGSPTAICPIPRPGRCAAPTDSAWTSPDGPPTSPTHRPPSGPWRAPAGRGAATRLVRRGRPGERRAAADPARPCLAATTDQRGLSEQRSSAAQDAGVHRFLCERLGEA